ncbi:MAG TPA: universal stress protein [Gaiellaceae bacterium]|nr:universal stress protein [Gaiellaceae bacterium]
MINPLRSEAEAFRFLLGAAVYFGLIAIAGVINTWLGLAVFVLLTAVVIGWWWHARREEQRPKAAPVHRGGPDERRILVVANETVGGGALRDQIEKRSSGYRTEVLVVTPALNTKLKTFTSDEDRAREQAQQRLDASLERLREAGIEARGEVGDGDPLQAMEDALRTFGADEIIISTHPEGRSHWLERGVVEGARDRFAVPITHVVVDLEAEREEVR